MAEENVQKLLDMLYEMIDEAKNAPLSNDKCVLNRDEALDLLDEIRAQMPVELKRAQELVRARDEYVEAAKRDVERMMQKAEFEAKSKVSESEVLTAARAKGHDIVTRAEERSPRGTEQVFGEKRQRGQVKFVTSDKGFSSVF